jgi:hypothetical protein
MTRYIRGFSHFVTSMTAPTASGWSDSRVGFSPTGKRRLCTAHAIGFTFGAFTNYYLNYYYTFASDKNHTEAIAKFFTVALVGMSTSSRPTMT